MQTICPFDYKHRVIVFEQLLKPDRGGDIAGLLRWLRPDVVIVDSEAGAAEAAAFALEHGLPLLHISVRDRELRLFRHGEWEQVSNGEGPSPETVRNVVAGSMLAGRAQRSV